MVIIRTPISDYCQRNRQILGDAFVQQYCSIMHYLPAASHEFNKDVRAFVEEYYHMLCHSPADAAKFYDDASVLSRYEKDGSKSVTSTLTDIHDKILSLKYDEFVDMILIISLDVRMSINSKVHVIVSGFLTRKGCEEQSFSHSFLLVLREGGFFVSRDTFRYVDDFLYEDFMHSDDGNKLSASDVDEIYYSGRTLSHLEKVDKCPRQLAEEYATGEVSVVKEEELPVAKVLDQVQDNPYMVEQSAGKIIEIVSDRASASTSLSSGDEFQDGRSLVNPRRRKVAKKMESHGPANADLQQLDHGIAEVIDEVQDDSQMVVQSVVKIEKVLKKSSASIDSGRPSASSTSHSSRSEFQEGESSHVDPHRNKVPKTMESKSPTNPDLKHVVRAIADEYFELRQTAEVHRGKSEHYKNRANTAHSKVKLQEADLLSKLASSEAEKAQKVQMAARWASQVIFTARSMIGNITTIDLHYQSVDDAKWYLKRYLKLLSSIQCVLILIVITGKGRHSTDGVPKIKPEVISILEYEKIEWEEEKGNLGALRIKLYGKRKFKFSDAM